MKSDAGSTWLAFAGRRDLVAPGLTDEPQDHGVSCSTAWPSRLSRYTPFPSSHWSEERLTSNRQHLLEAST